MVPPTISLQCPVATEAGGRNHRGFIYTITHGSALHYNNESHRVFVTEYAGSSFISMGCLNAVQKTKNGLRVQWGTSHQISRDFMEAEKSFHLLELLKGRARIKRHRLPKEVNSKHPPKQAPYIELKLVKKCFSLQPYSDPHSRNSFDYQFTIGFTVCFKAYLTFGLLKQTGIRPGSYWCDMRSDFESRSCMTSRTPLSAMDNRSNFNLSD